MPYQLLYVITATVRFLIATIQFFMLVRAILSWFPVEDDHPIVGFVYTVTEPVIMPMRSIVERFGLFEGMPIDMSFFITFILLSIIGMIL